MGYFGSFFDASMRMNEAIATNDPKLSIVLSDTMAGI